MADPQVLVLQFINKDPKPSYLAGFSVDPRPIKKDPLRKEFTVKYGHKFNSPFGRNDLPPLAFVDEQVANGLATYFNSLSHLKVTVVPIP